MASQKEGNYFDDTFKELRVDLNDPELLSLLIIINMPTNKFDLNLVFTLFSNSTKILQHSSRSSSSIVVSGSARKYILDSIHASRLI